MQFECCFLNDVIIACLLNDKIINLYFQTNIVIYWPIFFINHLLSLADLQASSLSVFSYSKHMGDSYVNYTVEATQYTETN